MCKIPNIITKEIVFIRHTQRNSFFLVPRPNRVNNRRSFQLHASQPAARPPQNRRSSIDNDKRSFLESVKVYIQYTRTQTSSPRPNKNFSWNTSVLCHICYSKRMLVKLYIWSASFSFLSFYIVILWTKITLF